jgi:hypothetical protein
MPFCGLPEGMQRRLNSTMKIGRSRGTLAIDYELSFHALTQRIAVSLKAPDHERLRTNH